MTIFITGATGYIGGAIATRFVAAGHQVRGLVRSEEKAAQLAAQGIVPVLGDLDSSELLVREARGADAVINAADSDHRGAVEALVEGLDGSGKTFLHTSGTGLVVEDTKGEASERIYDDGTPLTPTPVLAERAEIDRFVMVAADRGVRSVVLCNSLIYGHGQGLHRDSVMTPWLIRQAREDGIARYVGSGRATWSNVHIEDMIDLYALALDRAPDGSRYLVENGETAFAEIAQAIADRFNLGAAQSWTVEEATAKAGDIYAFIFGSTCRVRAARARAELGWTPHMPSHLDWIKQEA